MPCAVSKQRCEGVTQYALFCMSIPGRPARPLKGFSDTTCMCLPEDKRDPIWVCCPRRACKSTCTCALGFGFTPKVPKCSTEGKAATRTSCPQASGTPSWTDRSWGPMNTPSRPRTARREGRDARAGPLSTLISTTFLAQVRRRKARMTSHNSLGTSVGGEEGALGPGGGHQSPPCGVGTNGRYVPTLASRGNGRYAGPTNLNAGLATQGRSIYKARTSASSS
jgi:hypothetical protein